MFKKCHGVSVTNSLCGRAIDVKLATAQSGLDVCDGWNNQFMLLLLDIHLQPAQSFAVGHD